MRLHETEIELVTDNLLLNRLSEKQFPSVDSFTVDQQNNKISSLIMLNQDLAPSQADLFSAGNKNSLTGYFSTSTVCSHHLDERLSLANLLGVPLYLFSFTADLSYATIFSIRHDQKKGCHRFSPQVVNNSGLFSLLEVQNFINDLRHEQRHVIKPLTHLVATDLNNRLAQAGVSLGGNLDGFSIKDNEIRIVEFSKIGASARNFDFQGDKTKNYHFQYMKQDYGR